MKIAPIYLASRGLVGHRDPTLLKTGDLQRAENIGYSVGNLLEKDGGAVKVNAAALSGAPRLVAGVDWWPTSDLQRRVVATSDGKLYKDDMTGAFATVLKSGLTPNRVTQFSEGGSEGTGRSRKLFSCNGRDPVQVLAADGTTTADLSNPPADWAGQNQPTVMFLFRGYNVGAGNDNDPHRLYLSLGADHEDFLSAQTFNLSVYPGDGQRIVAGLTALGRGWVWKYGAGQPGGVFWINDVDASNANWYVQPATRQYGAARTPHAVAQIDEATVAFLSNAGSVIFMQETSGSTSGVSFTDLFKALNLLEFVDTNFELTRLDQSQLRWSEQRKQLHVTFAAKGSTRQDRRLVIDFNSERTRIEVSAKETCESIWMEADGTRIGRPVAGDHVGFLRKLDQGPRTVDGAAYTMHVVTAPTDFSDLSPTYAGLKRLRYLHLEYESSGNYNLPVTVYVDGRNKGTVQFNMGGQGGATFPFTFPATFGGTALRRRTRKVVGEGYYVSLDISQATAENPRLARAWLEFDVISMRR